MIHNRSFYKIAIGFFIALGIGGGVAYYYVHQKTVTQSAQTISFYEPRRDRQAILDMFYKDLYWLTTNEDYSAEFMIDTRSPNEYALQYYGKLLIKVMREGDKLIGFTAYYMKNFYEGTVLFLAIDSDSRGKHYGETLIMNAIDELKKQGASIISLFTRVNNYRAQKLYERIGFEKSADDGVMYTYIKNLEKK
jgi:ribosomal protein S18 acetylase RimI-like enzyme